MKRNFSKVKNELRQVRHKRVRAKIKGDAQTPRLSVFRGLKNITLQIIDDAKGATICFVKSSEIKDSKVEGKQGKIALAYATGKKLAEVAKSKGVEKIVFDRGGYRYHGRVAAAAEGARDGGLQF